MFEFCRVRVVGLLVVVLGGGCTPVIGATTTPPVSPTLFSGKHELGFGFGGLSRFDNPDEDVFAGTLTVTRRWGDLRIVRREAERTGLSPARAWWTDLALVAVLGQAPRNRSGLRDFGAGTQIGLRFNLGRIFADRVAVGGFLTGGLFWVGMGPTVGVRIGRRVAAQVSPGLTLEPLSMGRLDLHFPVNLTVALTKALGVSFELQTRVPLDFFGSSNDVPLFGGNLTLVVWL